MWSLMSSPVSVSHGDDMWMTWNQCADDMQMMCMQHNLQHIIHMMSHKISCHLHIIHLRFQPQKLSHLNSITVEQFCNILLKYYAKTKKGNIKFYLVPKVQKGRVAPPPPPPMRYWQASFYETTFTEPGVDHFVSQS